MVSGVDFLCFPFPHGTTGLVVFFFFFFFVSLFLMVPRDLSFFFFFFFFPLFLMVPRDFNSVGG